MDSESLNRTRLSTSSRRHQSRSDLYFGVHEETLGDDDSRVEFFCPFCAEGFDIVGLCCHIDEDHPVEAKSGICPICTKRVGPDLVGHFTMQHGVFLKVQRKRRSRRGGSSSTFSVLRKELCEGNLQSLLAASSGIFSSKSSEPDPLLSSFMFNQHKMNEPTYENSHPSIEVRSEKRSFDDEDTERNLQQVVSDKDRKEKALKSNFVQGVLLSTIFDDDL